MWNINPLGLNCHTCLNINNFTDCSNTPYEYIQCPFSDNAYFYDDIYDIPKEAFPSDCYKAIIAFFPWNYRLEDIDSN